jgi:hypothetical protein
MAVPRVRRWLQSILNERPTSGEELSTIFYLEDLYALCTQPPLRDLLARVAALYEYSHVNLRFDFSEAMDITMRDFGMNDDALLLGAAQVGEIMGRFKSLDDIGFHQCSSASFPFALALLTPCKQIKKLVINFPDEEENFTWEHLRAQLEACFSDHPTLEEVQFGGALKASFFQMIGAVIQMCSDRVACRIYTLYDLSLEAYSALLSLLQIESTCSLHLAYLIFDTEAKVRELCEALRLINNLRVKMTQPSFTDEMNVATQIMLGQALTNLVELELPSLHDPRHSDFREALWQNMRLASCKLHVLRVEYMDNDSLIPMLSYAPNWTLRELHFYRVEWTPAFDGAISAYLAETKHLLKLSLDSFPSGGPIASEALLKALDRPDQPVEMLRFGLTDTLDSEWLKQFQFIMKLNSQRRQHRPRLLEIDTVEKLVAAWQEVGHDCMVVFLLRDEFDLKTKFGELMQQLVGYQSNHSSEQE